MSKTQKIVLNPKSRRDHKAAFVKANPWTVGKTLGDIKALVESGDETLKGGFVFPEPTPKKARASRTTKGGSPKGAKRASTVTARKGKGKKAKAEEPNDFVTWLRSSAEARHNRQRSNKAQAEWMRSEGIVPSGQAWTECSKGERSVKVLKALNAKDGLAMSKAKGKAGKKGVKVPVEVKTEVVAEVQPSTTVKRPQRLHGGFMNKTEADLFHRLVTSGGLSETDARKAVSAL